jgi:hypothetical protein
MMKQTILLFLLAFLPLLAHAFAGEVEIDGINYFIKTSGQIAEVKAKRPRYSGDVVIPPSVEYEGVTCNVILIADGAFTYCSSLTSAGIQAGSAVSKNGVATVSTNLQPGSIAIIKIGNRSVKYMVP